MNVSFMEVMKMQPKYQVFKKANFLQPTKANLKANVKLPREKILHPLAVSLSNPAPPMPCHGLSVLVQSPITTIGPVDFSNWGGQEASRGCPVPPVSPVPQNISPARLSQQNLWDTNH